jgi:hypothetical protein
MNARRLYPLLGSCAVAVSCAATNLAPRPPGRAPEPPPSVVAATQPERSESTAPLPPVDGDPHDGDLHDGDPHDGHDVLLHDFRGAKLNTVVTRKEAEPIARRFDDRRAKAYCRYSALTTVTRVAGAFSAANANETVYLIDYCHALRRVVVLAGETAVINHTIPTGVVGDRLVDAVDVDGDGREELLVARRHAGQGTAGAVTEATLLRLAPDGPTEVAKWTALVECPAARDGQSMTTHTISFRRHEGVVRFRDVPRTWACPTFSRSRG